MEVMHTMAADGIPTPGGTIQHRKCQFFWLVDRSGSMLGSKMGMLNYAISEAIPAIISAASSNPQIQVEMRAIRFSDRAEWHIGPDPVPLNQFRWEPLQASGLTATAGAIRLLMEQLTPERMPPRGVPPVCILLSDGYCSDPDSEYRGAIDQLAKMPWGAKAVRLAIGIGDDDAYNEEELLRFVSHKEIGVLRAGTPQKLVNYIRWASTVATKSATQGQSSPAGAAQSQHAVQLPKPSESQANLPTANIAANAVF
jgi:uncharacterized protein YegL